MSVLLPSLIFFGLTAAVLWTVWRVPTAFRSRKWIQPVARIVGLVFSYFTGALAVLLLSSYSRDSSSSELGGSPMSLLVGILFAFSALLFAIGSIGPASSAMRRVLAVGWTTMMFALFLSGILALLVPIAAVGSASFMWRTPAKSQNNDLVTSG